ncbi:hypothetical protein N7481_003767 [Penicillium waksmanii]|uniref:uncharacterized protein n=1 Tax=Penicillium waksmanii TaxID=69791 RepID=UPI00254698F5|nr:uncharacterized protein N7481_003767 [Penicillium waksmanii]KAJ5988557.1 hypothetical protein N7481_003767 [Penicillium waksmanii]
MAPSKPRQPTLQNSNIYDNWVSHSTGHQVADSPYSNTTAWRDTRAKKLRNQYRTGDCLLRSSGEWKRGQEQLSGGTGTGSGAGAFDGTLGPDSPETDAGAGAGAGEGRQPVQKSSRPRPGGEYRWVSDAEAKRSQMGVRDIRSFMGVSKRKADDKVHWTEKKLKWLHTVEEELKKKRQESDRDGNRDRDISTGRMGVEEPTPNPTPTLSTPKDENQNQNQNQTSNPNPNLNPDPKSECKSTLLTGTSIYINGTTLPQISDHKLKHLLVAHGANVASFMARKGVTHIIVAPPGTTGAGAGGGLAARKLQTEISRGGWKGVKIVGVEWALESIKVGKRLAESKFSVLTIAPKGQRSVTGFFGGA